MIRILPEPSQRRAALLSLTVAGGAAALMIGGWFAAASPAAQPAVQRTFRETTLTWRCAHGHEFKETGQFPPPTCSTCNAPSHALIPYYCTTDGGIKLEVRFAESEGRVHPAPTAVRTPGLEWKPVRQSVRCPDCDSEVRPAPFTWHPPHRG